MGYRRFGYLRKLPSGRWQASYRGPDGKRHTAPATFEYEKDADIWLGVERQRASDPQTWTSPKQRKAEALRKPEVRTLESLYQRFLSQRSKPLALATRTSYDQDWRLRIEPHWGADCDVTKITHDDVWDWRQGPLAGERRRDRSSLALLSEMLQKAVQWRWIDHNPAQGVSIPKKTTAFAERHVFDLVQLRQYLEAADSQHVALLATVALGGLRSGEVRALRRRDIDLEKAQLTINQAVEYGKTEDGYQLGIKPPKTAAGRRVLPMSQALVGILSKHLEAHPCLPDALVFPGVAGKPMGPSAPDQAHNRALANMGLRTPEAERRRRRRRGEKLAKEDHITLHGLRASYAAWLFTEGYTVQEVMALLGWSDSKMALEVYARVFPERMAETAQRQDAALGSLNVKVT